MMRRTRTGALQEADMEPTSYTSPYEKVKGNLKKKSNIKAPETAYSHIPSFTSEEEKNMVTF